VREISREPKTHEFLIKALREAAGELVGELESVRGRDARRCEPGEWSVARIATHLVDSEELRLRYVEQILSHRSLELEPLDLGGLADDRPESALDLTRSAYAYAHHRQELIYTLWGLSESQWQRVGVHRYGGPISILQLARELHLHDLEHLWQVRSLREAIAAGAV
jgi:hypothetical protein